MTVVCMVGGENDFSSGGSSIPSNAQPLQDMNPNQHYNQGFYGQTGGNFGQGPGGGGGHGGGYPGPMSPYGGGTTTTPHGGGAPMSPYSQGQGHSPTASGQQQTLYANQNSQYNNQSQSSSYSSGGGSYQPPPGFHPQQPMQSYYNNHSPTHFSFGGGGGAGAHLALRHPANAAEQGPPRGPVPPHPMGMMMGARIPHPHNSPNQNMTGNQIKTESMDLKSAGGGGLYAGQPPPSQGYTQSGFGFNGYGGGGGGTGGPPTRPILSPMSPHGGRLNMSPGGGGAAPNLSPRDGPPNMSPHSGHPSSLGNNLYSGQQHSPGNNSIISSQASSFQPQYNPGYDYYSKQTPPVSQMQHPSPLSQGSSSYSGQKDDADQQQQQQRGNAGPTPGAGAGDDKLSDVQSNASAGGETPQHNTFSDDNNSSSSNLVNVKKEASEQSGDSSLKPGDEPNNPSNVSGDQHAVEEAGRPIKSEKLEGFNYEDVPNKDYANHHHHQQQQALMDNMNLDSIPELPDIPELKYEDMPPGMGDRLRAAGIHKEALLKPPSSPSEEGAGGGQPLGPHHLADYMEEHKDDGYPDSMGWHMQGMEPGYPPPHMQYPNQQQMWANFYSSGGAPPDDHNGGRYPGPMSPHMGMEGWWGGGPHPGPPDMSPYRMGSPGMPPAPGPWAMRGPRPRGERRGPGRPRLTSKGERGSRPRNPSTPGSSPFYPGQEGIPPDMMGSPGEMKRGPGRPKALLDPNAPKVPGETTKNGNKKRYTCEVCQKRFSTAWYVRVHRRSHNGERPYVCNNCGKGFMLPNVLQVHLRKCEKNNPPSGGTVGGTGPQGPIALAPRPSDAVAAPPNQSPSQTSSPSLGGGGGGGASGFGFPDPSSLPQSQAQQFPGMGAFNQRYMGGMTPPNMSGQSPYPPNLGPDNIPLSGAYPPDHPSQRYGMPEHPPPPGMENRSPGSQFSPIYSPGSSNLPPTSESEHHFLANDKPRDKGGTENDSPQPFGADQPQNYCTTCDVTFEDKSQTEEHLKIHRPFSCEVCEKRFSQKCNLVTHLRLHTGEKPYNCDFCEKRFTQKGNLDAHIKTHTKEKPFQCSLCSKRFAFKSSLQTHMKNHQNGTLSLDVDEDDIETIKLHARMQQMDQPPPLPGLPRSAADLESYHSAEDFDSNPGTSPSISPPSADFGATVSHLATVCAGTGAPDTDISKLTDSRQTLAMLQ